MPRPTKKRKDESESDSESSSASESESVSSEGSDKIVPAKKKKTADKPAKKASAKAVDDGPASDCPHRQDKPLDGCDASWKLANAKDRYVTISEFKGRTLVGIREYYEKNGKLLPGKGASLTIEQWKSLTECVDDVNAVLAKRK